MPAAPPSETGRPPATARTRADASSDQLPASPPPSARRSSARRAGRGSGRPERCRGARRPARPGRRVTRPGPPRSGRAPGGRPASPPCRGCPGWWSPGARTRRRPGPSAATTAVNAGTRATTGLAAARAARARARRSSRSARAAAVIASAAAAGGARAAAWARASAASASSMACSQASSVTSASTGVPAQAGASRPASVPARIDIAFSAHTISSCLMSGVDRRRRSGHGSPAAPARTRVPAAAPAPRGRSRPSPPSVTESTPGRMPAAVTQCTASVGTPKANRRGCGRPAASSSRYGRSVTASPPVSYPAARRVRYGPALRRSSSRCRSSGSAVRRRSALGQPGLDQRARRDRRSGDRGRRPPTNAARRRRSATPDPRPRAEDVQRPPPRSARSSPRSGEAGGPIERNALSGVYQPLEVVAVGVAGSPPWSTTSRISLRRSRSTSRAALSGPLTLPCRASATSRRRYASSQSRKSSRPVNFRSP